MTERSIYYTSDPKLIKKAEKYNEITKLFTECKILLKI